MNFRQKYQSALPPRGGRAKSRIGAALSLFLTTAALHAAGNTADLELSLAVDASGSVDEREFDLQLRGIAGAFRDARVIEAIGSGPARRIAVNLVVWAEHQVPKDISTWLMIGSAAEAEDFARMIEGWPRRVNGATGLGEGLAAALHSIDSNGITAPREVVDVSGDGAETPAREFVVTLPQARGMAALRGVTVNGLAILGSEEGLADWYRSEVLTGPESFLVVADGYENFADAMTRKLIREVEHRPKLSAVFPWAR